MIMKFVLKFFNFVVCMYVCENIKNVSKFLNSQLCDKNRMRRRLFSRRSRRSRRNRVSHVVRTLRIKRVRSVGRVCDDYRRLLFGVRATPVIAFMSSMIKSVKK